MAETRKELGARLAKEISNALNDFGSNETANAFLEAIARDHRTLQQSFSGLVFAWIGKLAEKADSGDFDGRNEYSVKLAKRIMTELKLDKWDLKPPLV